ncbi:hypothetical protein, partial [Hungatella hathewayi]|uniref:hypothetical protein n=1 Tax=Hungatella hathewayi TaxID=154046 RepID=UPI001C02CEE6
KNIVKLPKFSGGISTGRVDNRFVFSPDRDNLCVITVSSELMVFRGIHGGKYPGLSSFYLISGSFIHRHYDESAARTDSLFSSFSGKIPVIKQRSGHSWHPVQRISSSGS